MEQNRQTPPPLNSVAYQSQMPPDIPNHFKKKNKKAWITFSVIVVAVIAFFTAIYIVRGPACGDKHVARLLERLRQDSIALNSKDIYPMGIYAPGDVRNEVNKIKEYGNPTRIDEYYSDFILTDPRIAPLAQYNIQKCKDVLEEVLPQWRRIFANSITIKPQNEGVLIARAEGDSVQRLALYSMRYLDPKEAEDDYYRYAGAVQDLGFTEYAWGLYPGGEYQVKTFKKSDKKSNQ